MVHYCNFPLKLRPNVPNTCAHSVYRTGLIHVMKKYTVQRCVFLNHRVLFINVALRRETKSCPLLCTVCGTCPANCLQCEHLHMQLVSLLLLFKSPLFKIFSCISRNTLKHWPVLHLNMASLHVYPDQWWNFHIRALRCIRARAPVLGRRTAYSVLCQLYACSPVQSTSFDPQVT